MRSYTDEDDAVLRKHCHDPTLTCGQIGAKMDPPRHKNSVIGRMHRLGLFRPQLDPKTLANARARGARTRYFGGTVMEMLVTTFDDNFGAHSKCQGELYKDHEMHWNVCGEPVKLGSRYCDAHHARYYIAKKTGNLVE